MLYLQIETYELMNNRLKIGITQGDTNGVGWELILKILSDNRITELCTPIVYGSSAAASYYERTLKEYDRVKFLHTEDVRREDAGRI